LPKRRNQKSQKQTQSQRPRRKQLKPKTDNQEDYIACIKESDITFCSGPAGSGKTTVSVGLACEYFLGGSVERIIITRPVVEAGRGLGFLPGTLTDKIQPYLVPVVEEMKLYLGKDTYHSTRSSNQVEMCPLEYMRGRNFHNSFMILDEAQNATYEQIKMFITRIGIGSKAVINGDISQTDLPSPHEGGLDSCMDKLSDVEGVSVCELTSRDIVRSGIISKILAKL
jgi:phosphate starvation-inducible protein PhoH and related proteins